MSSAPHEVYSRYLFGAQFGQPLWTPQLTTQLCESYQLEGLKIGDVGIVSPFNGGFDVLFNITLPRDEQPFPELVREGFTPITLNQQRDLDIQPDAVSPTQGVFPRGSVQLISAQVHDRDQKPSRTDYEFGLSAGDGAVLVLPEGAESCDLKNEKTFLGEAIRHGVDWYECATETAGRLINNDSLYLITGFHKARSWSLGATYESGPNLQNQRSLGFEVGQIHEYSVTARAYRWAVVQGFIGRVGPESPYEIPNYITDERRRGVNQTVFIRGFRIMINKLLFLKTVSVKTRRGTFGGLGAYIDNFLWGRTSESTPSSSARGATDNAVEQDVSGQLYGDTQMTIDRVPNLYQGFHPGDSINQYMLKKEPRAMVAVTHDSLWIEMLQMGLLKLADFSLETCLENVLSDKYRMTVEDGKCCTVYLQKGHVLESPPHKHSDSTPLSSPETSGTQTPSTSGLHTPPLLSGPVGIHPLPSGPVGVHPLLAFHPKFPPIIYDVSLPPHTIAAPNVKASSSSLLVEGPATQPGMYTMTLVIDQFPWRMTIPPSKHHVSVRDLLEALYAFLRHPVLPSEYNTLPTQALKDEVSIAFHTRCGRAPSREAADEQYQKGLRRVDFLRGRTRFMGLSSTKVGPDVWALNIEGLGSGIKSEKWGESWAERVGEGWSTEGSRARAEEEEGEEQLVLSVGSGSTSRVRVA